MKYVDSGRGKFPFISLVAILTVSLVVNLPGLAVSPLLGELDKIFPTASHMEIQLLSILPNLVIIPFVLLSGKLSESKSKISLLFIGLGLFLISGIIYFFAESMTILIWNSCILGIGCGFVIPIAAGLLADNFYGPARMKYMGMKSGISNFALIIATIIVGWLGLYGWHVPFLVYFIPIVPLVLLKFASSGYINKHSNQVTTAQANIIAPSAQSQTSTPAEFHFSGKKSVGILWGIMALYFFSTISTQAITYYLPFVMQSENFNSNDVGIITSIAFAGVTASGFILSIVVKWLKHWSVFTALIINGIGLIITSFADSMLLYIIGGFVLGLGYGIIQPIIYNKATYIAPTPAKATSYLAYVLATNYVCIASSPFLISAIKDIFNIQTEHFPFYLATIFTFLFAVLSLIFFKSYVFRVNMENYGDSTKAAG